MYAVKMKIRSPLHIGKEGLGMEEASMLIHSDTLYCAIYSAWQDLYPFEGELPIRISSAYPYVEDTFFFPKPRLPAPGFEDAATRDTYAKDVKKAAFVDHDSFGDWLRGEPTDFERLKQRVQLVKENVTDSVRPRVSLDRVSCDTSLYFIGEVLFNQDRDCGLYFLVDCETTYWNKLKTVLEHLGECGIGGERSCGYGRFLPAFQEDFELPAPVSGSKYLSLSLLLPAGPEEASRAHSYQLLKRGGWSKDTPHQQVFMFAEGSVFNSPVEGMTATVADVGHPVYRMGRSFLVKAR